MTSTPFDRIPGFVGRFRHDEESRAVYAESAGIARLIPTAIAEVSSPDDVVALVRWAAKTASPLVARGSGSSMGGGAVGRGIVVDLSRLTEVEAVDTVRQRVAAGPGATRAAVERAANICGMRFPVDPSSGAFATIGGMAATNAAGARSLRFGAMRRWVQALDCVLADGTRVTVRRGASLPADGKILARWGARAEALRARARALPPRLVRKESSGYGVGDFAASGELLDLLVGSEGTLALIVGVELSLAPIPVASATVLASWASIEASVAGAALARDFGAAACELLDRTFLDIARRGASLPVPAGTDAVLLIELEGTGAAAVASTLARACEGAGATGVLLGLDAESEEALWALRHAASPILARLDPHLRSMQLVEDGCVPPPLLGEYVRGVRGALDAAGIRGVIFGHAGDAHVHVNALVDVREPEWRERIRRFCDEVVTLTAALGGTLAGEHGDGRLRTPWMSRTWSAEAIALFRDIKELFDPLGILNPGVKVAGAEEDILTANKYDPLLPPLPPRARHVLDRVEHERAYDRSRLDLLEMADEPH